MLVKRGVSVKRINCILCSFLLMIIGAFFVSGQTTATINVPVNGTWQADTVTIKVTLAGHINVTNATFSITNPAGTVTTIGTNQTLINNNASNTAVYFSWATDNGNFAEASGYTFTATFNITNQSGGANNCGSVDCGGLNTSFNASNIHIDNSNPNVTVKFTDEDGTAGTTFDFGEEITVDCQATDHLAGLNTSLNMVQIKFPDLTTHMNLSISDLERTNSTFKATIGSELTDELGDYNIVCLTYDKAGNLNSTNKTFTLITKLNQGSSIFAQEGWVSPISKKVIGKGTVEDFGVLPGDGEPRLIAKLGAIVINIGGEDHTVKVEDITDNSASLSIDEGAITLEFLENETKQVDTNGDGMNDLEIFMNKIHTGKADLLFTEIYAPAPVEEAEEEFDPVVKEEIGPVAEEKEISFGWLWFLLLVVLIIIIIMAVVHKVSRKGESGGPGNVRFTSKDLGLKRDDSQFSTSGANSQGSGNSNLGGRGSGMREFY